MDSITFYENNGESLTSELEAATMDITGLGQFFDCTDVKVVVLQERLVARNAAG